MSHRCKRLSGLSAVGKLSYVSIISSTRDGVSFNFQTPRKELKVYDAQRSIFTKFEVFGNRKKHFDRIVKKNYLYAI